MAISGAALVVLTTVLLGGGIEGFWRRAHEAKQAKPVEVGIGSATLVKLAVHRVTPTFPPGDLESGVQGPAVAQVLVDSDGRTARVSVLQAPSPAMALACERALREWRFRVLHHAGSPARMRAKVVFYFVIRSGRGEVVLAQELAPPEADLRGAPPAQVITEAEWQGRPPRERPILVDIRSRELFARARPAGSVNIPEDELDVRAPAELQRERTVAVDCRVIAADLCEAAAALLRRAGFTTLLLTRR